jgi:hypothetical protein
MTQGGFKKNFKNYDENKSYSEFTESEVEFNSETLQLNDVEDIHTIMQEINKLSYTIYVYGSLCDSQARVVQQIEDEFEKWKAKVYFDEKIDDKKFKSENNKERQIMIKYGDEFWKYSNNIRAEKYKLSLLQRVMKSLEHFGYKLHDLKDYNLAINRNS